MSRVLLIVLLSVTAVSCRDRSEPDKAPREPAEVPVPAEPKESASGASSGGEPSPSQTDEDVKLAPKLLPREEVDGGWVQLFDGQTLFGWMPNDDPAKGGTNWSVRDGVITADQGDKPGLLLTFVPWADYEFRCEYRLEEGGNSGVFLRTVAKPDNPAIDCYELNMADVHPSHPTGSLVGRKKADRAVKGEGKWTSIYVLAEGRRIRATFDGEQVFDFTDISENVQLHGHIGLQHNRGQIEFRNVSLRPLGTTPIFDGESLSGWREVPGSKSEFDVEDGTIHVTNGRGYLETEQTWDHFVLQAEAKTNGTHLNSGIFFRALPGTAEAPANGYEYQIHYGYKDGDRTKPADFGTGGIYRRIPARYVIGDDKEWVALTLVAHGPRIMTWVNGYPVVAWEDWRPRHENPREGLRMEAGHVSLQGHDPTTDLAFRNLRLAE
jgi:hypothetical protein